jgi:hypothetical protein
MPHIMPHIMRILYFPADAAASRCVFRIIFIRKVWFNTPPFRAVKFGNANKKW